MNSHKCKKLVSIAGLALGLSLAAGSAQSSLLYQFEDDDVDAIYRPGTGVIKTGPILVGDVLISVLEIPTFTINGVPSIPAGQELTGVAAIQVFSIGVGGTPYIFTPAAIGLNAVLALGADPDATVGAPGDPGGGAMVAMFLNGTSGAGGDINLDISVATSAATNCGGTLAGCINQASRGTLFQVDGFKGDPDELWYSNIDLFLGGGDIGTVLATDNTTNVATFNARISNYFNLWSPVEFINKFTGAACGTPGYIADNCVQVNVTGTIQGGVGLTGDFFAHSDFDGKKYVVPEPGTLALLGLALAGLGFGSSRRKKVAA